MTIAAGETILAADIQAIKDDVDKLTDMATASIATSETTVSTSYVNLATTGPSVTVTTGTLALVFIVCRMSNDTAGSACFASFEVSGATTQSAIDTHAVQFESDPANQFVRLGAAVPVTLTAGSNTFTMKYKVSGDTGTFLQREIVVLPIGA